MMENGRGLIKALENWAKKVTSGYKDVDVRDLSTSFRDGLAFCAIVHHYRPDLINFDSLSKENIYENNSLAFSVAEKQLGVPALLDAEDMVKYSHPDRLSIITYLSQLRNCFENQNKVSKKPDLKRIQSNSVGLPAKVQPSLVSNKRHEVCQVCQHRVFILERLIVDGKLYHTTCFRCHKCQALLNPGAYVEGDAPGLYECTVCVVDEVPDGNDLGFHTPENHEVDVPSFIPQPEKDFTSKDSVMFAKSNLSQEDSKSDLPNPPVTESKNRSESSGSVKDKINVFEKNLMKPKSPLPSPILSRPIPRPRSSLLLSTHVEKTSVVEKDDMKVTSDFNSGKNSELLSPLREINGKNFPPAKGGSGSPKVPRDIFKSSDVEQESLAQKDDMKEIPDSNSVKSTDLSSPLREINGKNFSPVKGGSESPRVPRDIFKSSLSPLKLNLPSSVRKEPEKALNVSPISSLYSTTLPYSRSLSLLKQPDKQMKDLESDSDTSQRSSSKATRRSSLELTYKEDTTLTEAVPFSRTLSSQEMRGDLKAVPNIYTPVYKSLYNSSNLTNNGSASKLTFRHSYVDPKSSYDLENTEKKLNRRTEIFTLEKNSGMDPESTEKESKPSTEPFTPETDSHVGPESSHKSLKIQNKAAESDKDEIQLPVVGKRETESLGQESGSDRPHKSLKIQDKTTELEKKEISSPVLGKSETESLGQEEEYPDDLNPFGEDEGGEEEYPDDLNPFGDDEEEVANNSSKVDDYDESKNPFASDEDSSEVSGTMHESKILQDSIYSNVSSPSGSLKGTLKKRRAPRPPPARAVDIFAPPKDSAADSGVESSFSSPALSKKNFQTSSPKVRKSKPAPPPPPKDPAASAKRGKETDNMKLKMQQEKPVPKKKKRPAPSVPIPVRRDMKKIPLKEITREMKEIEEKQREYERQGREIELLIRDRDKDEEPSVEEEEYIMQLFELVNQKNALFRRQAELMYIKRSQRLEELQHQVEKEIRQLMEKPESEKTEEDRQKEEELTMELLDIVDQRNSIIDSIEMDRRRELEEDHSVQEQLEIKNGDLPITAEIKQKSSKAKKKAKKEKKKEEESSKGTLKKKKNLFSKRS